MHEMQTIVTDVHDVCQSVHHVAGSFSAAFAKSLWPLALFQMTSVYIAVR